MERRGLKTVRAVARVTGEDWSRIAKVLKILELPEPVLEYLRTHDSPEVVNCFTEGRLRKLVALKKDPLIWNRFRALLEEIGKSGVQPGQ
jgi:hypothetical protein